MPTKKSDDPDVGPTTPEDASAGPETLREDALASGSTDDAPPLRVDPDAPPADTTEPTPPPDSAATEPVAAYDEAHEEAHEEERGWSFAARALAFLLILLGGAALGIWAAPKIAPRLPSGLAPVAAWLTPGQADAEARIAELQSRLDTDLAALDSRIAALPDAAAVESTAAGLVSSARTDLTGEIDALKSTLSQADTGGLSDRIGRLESELGGATAALASLTDQISSGAAGGDGDATARIDAYRAELDGLKAEVATLSGSVSSLGQRLEEVAASAEARVAEAQTQAEQVQQAAAAERDVSAAQADLALIRAALASGAPFAEPLESLANAGITAPEGLTAAAATGVATPVALRASFADAAHQAIRASIVASAGEGVLARSRAFLEAQVASRSLTPQEGAAPDAVLSRAEDALRRDDLATALTEVEALPSEAHAAMQGWIESAQRRVDAETGLAELSGSISTLN